MMWELQNDRDNEYRRQCRKVLKAVGFVCLAVLYWIFWGTLFSLLFANSTPERAGLFLASIFMFPIGLMILKFIQVVWGAIFGRRLFVGDFGQVIDDFGA